MIQITSIFKSLSYIKREENQSYKKILYISAEKKPSTSIVVLLMYNKSINVNKYINH